jgi:hypothetical protein
MDSNAFTNVVAAFGKLKASRRDRSVSRSCFWRICTTVLPSSIHSFVLFRIPARQDRSAAVEIGFDHRRRRRRRQPAAINQSINQAINQSSDQSIKISINIGTP